jgi:glycosyltransferase involved in cell wall biosynthesis
MFIHNKTMLIIGNGPSSKELAEYGFHQIPSHVDTFGMGLAFKHFERVGWWPTYYICADSKVVQHRRESLARVVMDPKVRVKRFFFPIQLCESDRLEVIPHNSTGDFAFRKAMEFGYRQIFLIGIDLDYKPLEEATRISRSEFDELGLEIDYYTNVIYKIRRPVADHPNYFFPYYQEVGDIYSEPRGQSWHMLTWQRARELAEKKKITVRNLGNQSKLKAFERGDLRQALSSDVTLEAKFPKQSPAAVASEIFQAEKLLSDKYLRELGEAREQLVRLSGAANAPTADCTQSLEGLSREIAGAVTRQDNGIMVSVIIPAYNAAEFIAICLESLARQTLPQENFEVICIDDVSTDNTVDVIESYKGRIPNLKIIRQPINRKQGAARNAGIDAAVGRFATFLDSDDFLRLDMLELMLNLGRYADLTVCQHVKTRFDKPIKASTSNRRVESKLSVAAFENTIGWWPFGMLISRDLLNRQGIRFREGVSFEDIDFNIRLYMAVKKHVVTKEPLYYYIERDNSTVNLIDEQKLIDAASAMSETWRIAAGSPDDADREAFLRSAPRWLMLQARRLQCHDLPVEEKTRLAAMLMDLLTEAGLMAHLDPELGPIILKSATALPDSGETAPQQALQGNQGYRPWKVDYRDEFAGKVIFYCEVDYHIRSAAPVVRKLRQFGVESIVVDASRSTSFTSNRPLPDEELPLYADIDLRPFNVAKNPPFATEAAAFVFMNDLTYTRKLIFENFGFDVPTFGFYEGINDDWNLDRKAPRKPYRSTDYLLLPGLYQQGFYEDRQCRITGLPNVRARLGRPVLPPRLRRAIINVNFTYGVLEDRRGDYVESAVQACKELGLDYVISQHPADKADLSRFKVSRKSVYDLLDEGSILISRFSTTILEALAMGRPVVYHNSIGERVPKFHHPMGAYRKTHSVTELKNALEAELAFVEAGGAVRERAALFLHFHCNTGSPQEPDELAARAISEVLAVPQTRFAFKTGTIARRTVPPVARLMPPQGVAGTQGGTVPRSGGADGKGVPATGKPENNTAKSGVNKNDFIVILGNEVINANDGAESVASSFLRSCASSLLTDPCLTLSKLSNDEALKKAVNIAKNALPVRSPLLAHFSKTIEYAQSKK